MHFFLNITFSSSFAILTDFWKVINLLFWLYWISFFSSQSLLNILGAYIILDSVLSRLIKTSLTKLLFLYKKLLQIIFLFVWFFLVKNKNEK